MYKNVVAILFLSVFFFACQRAEPKIEYPGTEPPTTKQLGEISIIYGYQDASVPPDDHRSYTIYLTNENYRFVVDSYGEIIKDTTLVLANQKEKIKNTQKAFKSCKIKNREQKIEDMGCTGGNGEFIKIIRDGEIVFHGSNYYCAGKTEGNLIGDIKTFLSNLKSEVDPKVFEHR
ncbi:MAG: hypothetical protein P8I93_01960 [Crocinitomicaceae bacterium]|nr:hypothetical protein [Crocinitomicaceae bacterium]